jgi:hypothetical protein
MHGPLKQPSLGRCSCRSIEETGLLVVEFRLTEGYAQVRQPAYLAQDTQHVNNAAHGTANMHNSVPQA